MSQNKTIYYIANLRLPTEKAHGVQIMNMCSALAGLGHEVVLLVPKRINNIKQDPFDYYGLPKNFKIKKLFTLDLFKYEHTLGKTAFWLQLGSFYVSCFVYLLFKDQESPIYGRDHLVCLLSHLHNPIFYECHTIPETKQETFFKLAKYAKKIIVINDNLKQAFLDHDFNQENILIAPDGVDLEKFDIDLSCEQARQKLNLPLDKKIILYSGHLYAWKGVDTLALVAKNIKNAVIYFVGGTDRDIKKFKDKYSQYKNIILPGRIPHAEIPVWLKSADILVLPNSGHENISRLYTSPLKMFEYMAAKRPIIASRLPSLETILNNKNCLFFEADNALDLAKKIEELLKDNSLAGSLSNQAHQDVLVYTWEVRARQILDFIN